MIIIKTPSKILRLSFFTNLIALLSLFLGSLSIAGNPKSIVSERIDGQNSSKTAIAITNVNVVPMNRQSVISNQTVIIEDGVISKIGTATKIKAPSGALIVNGRGKYLIPGLIDTHIHIESDADLPLYTASGITSVLNLKGRPYHLDLRARIAAGKILGPRLFTSGAYIRDLYNADAAVQQIQETRRAGYDFVKIKGDWSPEAYTAAVAEAKRIGIKVVGHAPRNLPFEVVLQGGVENMAHMEEMVYTYEPLKKWYKNYTAQNNGKLTGGNKDNPAIALEKPIRQLAKLIKQANLWVVPTMIVIDNYVRQGAEPAFSELIHRPYMQYLDPITRKNWEGSFTPRYLLQFQQLLALEKHMVKVFQQEGVRMALGTDATNRPTMLGYSVHQELELMAESGLTPYQALQMATINGAEFLGASKEIGTIELGKKADLVLLNGNPLNDIRNTTRINGIVLNGKWLSKKTLDEHLNALKNSYADLNNQVISIDKAFKSGGGRAAVNAYQEIKSPDKDLPRYVEALINSEGYRLLGNSLKKEAIDIFKINVETFPQSSNAFDSLGEAYMLDGNIEPAIKNYEKSLELNPQNTNAVEKLKQLREKKP